MANSRFKPGDRVIFRKQKESHSPGPRAKRTSPAAKGDTYVYVVDKFWLVKSVDEQGHVQVMTRRGKAHIVNCDDPHLRTAKWWEKLIFASRFPDPDILETDAAAEAFQR